MNPHVLVDPLYALPEAFAHVERIIRNFDGALRLRKSVSQPGSYVLERKLSRSHPIQTAQRGTDLHLQAQDGYIHISLVHEEWLRHPENILRELKANDIWAQGGAETVDRQMADDERYAREDAERKRRETLREIAIDAFDPLNRMGGEGGTERTRIQNAGVVPAELPKTEIVLTDA